MKGTRNQASELLLHQVLIKVFKHNEAQAITSLLTKNIIINIWVRAKKIVLLINKLF